MLTRPRKLAALALLLSAAAAPAAAAPGDRDDDGIPDDVEINGVPGEPLLDFPTYGADPDVPDLFIQMDWIACDPILEYCGPNNSFDRHRTTQRTVEELAAFFAPDIAVHVDIGQWGGARRDPLFQPHVCNGDTLGVRLGTFHRGLASQLGTGGGGDMFGFCFGGDTLRAGVLAQEVGHNLGIGHGGNPDSYPANCKPHYLSPMNYAYTYDRALSQFSRGPFAGVVLNPTAMDELAGLGTTDPVVLDKLRASPWIYNVREDGAIDWNRDGEFSAGSVRATPTWAYASCEQSTPHSDFFPPVRDPVLAWLGGDDRRLVMVARHVDTGRLLWRSATRFDLCDPFMEAQTCTDWSPGKADPAAEVPGSLGGAGAATVASYSDESSAFHVMAVYAAEDGTPHAQRLDTGGAWSAPVQIDNARRLDGDPALVLAPSGDELWLYANAGGKLARWRYDIAADAWSYAGEETFGNGPILPCQGLALDRGWRKGVGVELVAAIPSGVACTLEIALYDESAGAWQALGQAGWMSTQPLAGGRPGLAFVPFHPDNPDEGRYYVAWRPFPAGAALISMSEGNDLDPGATSRRLVFWPGTFLRNVWATVEGGVTLHYTPGLDQNLRATWSYGGYNVQFQPFADGIIDVDMRDQDDYVFLKKYLACSLNGTCSP